jgi:DNA-binding NarL/FixJ family response regulator
MKKRGEGVEIYFPDRGIRTWLSWEQIRVIDLVVQGYTYREIGDALGMCRNTVGNRVASLKNALGAETRREAIFLLRDTGILTPPN